MSRSVGLALALFAVAATSCSRKPPNATPEGAVRELLIHLEGYRDGDPAQAKASFELLSKATQENLVARAARFSAASGKRIEPELMIAPASYGSTFDPKALAARIDGPYAIVTARGLLPEERAEIRCVFEDGGWRVHMDLPPLTPLKVLPRDGAGLPR
jgi:hypothetical protein